MQHPRFVYYRARPDLGPSSQVRILDSDQVEGSDRNLVGWLARAYRYGSRFRGLTPRDCCNRRSRFPFLKVI